VSGCADHVAPATDEMIEAWLNPPTGPYRYCRDLAGDGCAECAAIFAIDDQFIRALIARIRPQGLQR